MFILLFCSVALGTQWGVQRGKGVRGGVMERVYEVETERVMVGGGGGERERIISKDNSFRAPRKLGELS